MESLLIWINIWIVQLKFQIMIFFSLTSKFQDYPAKKIHNIYVLLRSLWLMAVFAGMYVNITWFPFFSCRVRSINKLKISPEWSCNHHLHVLMRECVLGFSLALSCSWLLNNDKEYNYEITRLYSFCLLISKLVFIFAEKVLSLKVFTPQAKK